MPGVARAQPPGLAFVPAGWWRACPLDRARARVSAAAESATEIRACAESAILSS
jgi:hypothetical protein